LKKENAWPGSNDWQLTRMKPDGSAYRSAVIEGYCGGKSTRLMTELGPKDANAFLAGDCSGL